MFRLYGKTLDFARTAMHYLICISLGLMLAVPGPTLLDLQRSIGEENTFSMGFIFTSRSIGYLLGSLIGGIVLDFFRYGEIALIFSSLFLAAGAFIIPFCRSFWPLMITFSVIGFAMGFSNTGSNACCLNIWGKKGAPVIQGLHFCFGLGGLLAPLLAAAFLPSNTAVPDMTLLGFSENYTMGLQLATGKLSSENSSDIEFTATISKAISVPSILYTYITIGAFTACVATAFVIILTFSSKEKPETSHLELNDVINPSLSFTIAVVVIAALQVGLISSVECSFSQLLTSYTVKGSHKLPLSTAYIMTFTYWGTFTLARAFTIVIAMKVRSANLLIFDFMISMTGIIVLLTMGTWSINALWAGTCIIGFGVASFFPGTLSWIEKYINMNNKVVSVFTVVTSLFEMTVPMTLNFYLESKPAILFHYMLGATITSSMLFGFLHLILMRVGEKYTFEIKPSPAEKEKMDVSIHLNECFDEGNTLKIE